MQQHHGQALNIGALLDASFAETGWRIRQSHAVVLKKSTREMAQLHLPNLRTWRRNEFASQAFDRRELDALELALSQIAKGVVHAGIVQNTARQIIAERV